MGSVFSLFHFSRSFLLPPTPSSGRASPSISEGSVSEEEQLNDKPSNPDESAEDVKKGTGPRTQLFKPQTKFIQNYQCLLMSSRIFSQDFGPRSFNPTFHTIQVQISQVISCQYRKYPKHSLKLTLGLIRPKQKFLGLMSVRVVSVLVKQ